MTDEEKKFQREKENQIKRLRKKKESLIDRFIGECEAINNEIRYWKGRKFKEL